jgi:hypothetical protein
MSEKRRASAKERKGRGALALSNRSCIKTKESDGDKGGSMLLVSEGVACVVNEMLWTSRAFRICVV